MTTSYNLFNSKVHDLVEDSIPKFDIIFSRHTMTHLKNYDVVKVMKHFYNSRSTYLIATNFPDIKASLFIYFDFGCT